MCSSTHSHYPFVDGSMVCVRTPSQGEESKTQVELFDRAGRTSQQELLSFAWTAPVVRRMAAYPPAPGYSGPRQSWN
jgi:hypothetical protein